MNQTMGDICGWPLEVVRRVIRESNDQSAKGSQKYVLWENSAIHTDYEFMTCPCNESCWCKRHACNGHYRIREMVFDQFLETYVKLWIPPKARDNIKNAVRFRTSFNGRQRNAVKPLQWLRVNWSDVLARVRGHNKCGLCDSSFPVGEDVTNLYQAKMWSQLLYDCVVPFDTKSKARIKKSHYTDPIKDFMAMNRELFDDLRKLSETSGLDVEGIRNLDRPWAVLKHLRKPIGGQPLSRVLDKMFYAPGSPPGGPDVQHKREKR
jgi:hypothetical protein